MKNTNPFKQKILTVMIASAGAGAVYADEVQNTDEKDEVIQLETVVVKAEEKSSFQVAKKSLEKVPGGTNLISAAQLEKGKSGTNEDVLALQPGVYAKSPGNEGTKVSIRGSGINRTPGAHASGVHVLLDDIPFTGPGGTPYELLEPLWLSRAEVFRGANGFDKGMPAPKISKKCRNIIFLTALNAAVALMFAPVICPWWIIIAMPKRKCGKLIRKIKKQSKPNGVMNFTNCGQSVKNKPVKHVISKYLS